METKIGDEVFVPKLGWGKVIAVQGWSFKNRNAALITIQRGNKEYIVPITQVTNKRKPIVTTSTET